MDWGQGRVVAKPLNHRHKAGGDIPRSNFDQDLLYSLGAFLTICEVKRNDAEKRIRAMAGKESTDVYLANQSGAAR